MRVGALYAILRLETGAFHSALGKAEGRFAAFTGFLKASAFIAAQAVAGIAAGSLFVAQSFEQHLNEALAIMTGVTDDMKQRMADAARAIAKESTFSANEAADAFFYLAGAGYDANQSIAALPVVTQFAQAGVMDLEHATELLMNAQMSMGLRSDDATENMQNMARVSDVLTRAQIESTATLEEMSESLINKAAPALRVVGKDIEEGAAALMVMANQGIKGRAAGTGLAIVLRELQTKAVKNKDAWNELGVAAFDASGDMRNMADIIGDLEGAMEGMSDEQRRVLLGQLGFTDRSMHFIQMMLGQSDAMREYEEQLRKAGGTTEEIAQKQLDTFNAQLEITWHKIQDVGISIGQALLPGARNMVEAIGNWIDANHELIVGIATGLFDALGKIVGFIMGAVSTAFQTAIAIWEAIEPTVMRVAGIIQGAIWVIRQAIAGNTDVLETLGGGWKVFGDIVQEVVDFVTETLIPALGAAFTWVQEEALPALADAFTWLVEEIMPILEGTFNHVTENVIPALGGVFQWLSEELIPKLVEMFTVIFETTVPLLVEAFDFVANDVIPRFAAAFNWVAENILPFLMGVVMWVVQWFTDNWPLISAVAEQVFGAVGSAFQILSNIIGTVVPIIWAILEPIATFLLPLIGGAASFLLEAMKFVFDSIGKVWQAFSDAAHIVAEAVMGAFEGIAGFFGGVWDGISDVFKGGLNFLVDAINGFLRFLNNLKIDLPQITIPGIDVTIGGGSIDPFNFGLIPRFAKGVRGFRGGLAVVGERGPELAYLPPGSDVFSNAESSRFLNGEMTVTLKDPDGAVARGGYSQEQIERVMTDALRKMVTGAKHRSLRLGAR